MIVTREITPVLFVTRLLFMLPYSSIQNSGPTLRSPLWLRLFTIIIHSILIIAYIYFAVLTLHNFKHAMHSISKASTFATLFIMQCFDIANSIYVMIISQRSCNLVENILRNLVTVNRTIIKCKSSKMTFLFISIYTVILYLFKCFISFVFLRHKKFNFTLAPVIASGMVIASESLLFVLCIQLHNYLYSINFKLRNAAKLEHFHVYKLNQAFEKLSDAQKEINHVFGPFLLLNLSQIVFFLLYLPLLFYSSCIDTDIYEKDCNVIKWVTMSILQLTFVLRLIMIIWGCSVVTNEAELTAIKTSRLLRREIDENTTLQLHALLETSLSRRLTFSACGFFNIDVPLLFSAGGVVTSYLFLITQLN